MKSKLLSIAFASGIIGVLTGKIVLFYINLIFVFIYLGNNKVTNILENFLNRIIKTIGIFLTNIFLTLTFVLIVIPIGFFYKKNKNNLLQLSKKDINSTFVDYKRNLNSDFFKNMW